MGQGIQILDETGRVWCSPFFLKSRLANVWSRQSIMKRVSSYPEIQTEEVLVKQDVFPEYVQGYIEYFLKSIKPLQDSKKMALACWKNNRYPNTHEIKIFFGTGYQIDSLGTGFDKKIYRGDRCFSSSDVVCHIPGIFSERSNDFG